MKFDFGTNTNSNKYFADDKWQNILSQIQFFWKNKTDVPSTTTEQTESHDNKGRVVFP